MRARHRRSLYRLEQLAGGTTPLAGELPARICDPGAVTSGLMMSGEAGHPVGPRDEKYAMNDPCLGAVTPPMISASDSSLTVGGDVRLDGEPVGVADVHGRHEVVVGGQCLVGESL